VIALVACAQSKSSEAPSQTGGDRDDDALATLDAGGGIGGIGGIGGAAGGGGVGGAGGSTSAESSTLPMCSLPSSELMGRGFGACVALADVDGGVEPSMFSGTVTGVVEEGEEFYCGASFGVLALADHVIDLRVGDGADAVKLRLGVPPRAAELVRPGDDITLRYARRTELWAGTQGAVEVRDADGALLVWIAQGNSGPAGLAVPTELQITETGDPCTPSNNDCGVVQRRKLNVRVGASEATIAAKESVEVGGFTIELDSNDSFEPTPPGRCTDISTHHRVVIAVFATKG
jgi:hypothetical protein